MVSQDCHHLLSIPHHQLGHKFREIYGQRTNSNEFVHACLIISKATSYGTWVSGIASRIQVHLHRLRATFCTLGRSIERVPARSEQKTRRYLCEVSICVVRW